jgi:hypothetical protein
MEVRVDHMIGEALFNRACASQALRKLEQRFAVVTRCLASAVKEWRASLPLAIPIFFWVWR